MIKKIILVFVLIFISFHQVSAFTCRSGDTACEKRQAEDKAFDKEQAEKDAKIDAEKTNKTWDSGWAWDSGDPSDITSKSFEVDTSLFSIGWNSLKWWDSKTTINNTLWNIIKKLMIALWVIALFVMTIWAWYMILYQWHDEYLSKWKNIFIWWITALIVALSSYYLVNFIWYILYS